MLGFERISFFISNAMRGSGTDRNILQTVASEGQINPELEPFDCETLEYPLVNDLLGGDNLKTISVNGRQIEINLRGDRNKSLSMRYIDDDKVNTYFYTHYVKKNGGLVAESVRVSHSVKSVDIPSGPICYALRSDRATSDSNPTLETYNQLLRDIKVHVANLSN